MQFVRVPRLSIVVSRYHDQTSWPWSKSRFCLTEREWIGKLVVHTCVYTWLAVSMLHPRSCQVKIVLSFAYDSIDQVRTRPDSYLISGLVDSPNWRAVLRRRTMSSNEDGIPTPGNRPSNRRASAIVQVSNE